MSVFKTKAGLTFPAPGMKNAIDLIQQLSVVFVVLLLFSCKKEVSSTHNELAQKETTSFISKSSASQGATITTMCFQAVAEIANCNGEDILFRGTIEMRESNTSTRNGNTKITRSFVAKGLEGWGVSGGTLLPATGPACAKTYTGTYTGTHYEVQGGAEMFNIHFGEGGSATLAGSDIFIHRGTLVFINTETGERIVARHVITKIPGQGLKENSWECAGNN